MKKSILNKLMKNGLKARSEKLYCKSLKIIQKKVIKNHNEIIKLALIHSSSMSLVRKKIIKRKRKLTFVAPFILKKKSRINFAINNIIELLKHKFKKQCSKDFTEEILQASKNLGLSVQKKKAIHEDSFLKKKFASFRWF